MSKIIAKQIHIKGLVQGVGFRPFVYRIALSHGIRGWVINGNDGVRLHAEGKPGNLDHFIGELSGSAPPASAIEDILVNETVAEGYTDFSIHRSIDLSDEITEVSPDIAVCDECLRDMEVQPHRIDYPFINCTNCGPRFTIVQDLPYDREKTTMAPFIMCETCRGEYLNILDRRFHAQPIACSNCGPYYSLTYNQETISDTRQIVEKTCNLLLDGRIIAIKGMGGFHLACNALDSKAVDLLRSRKNREGKPFAVMFGSVEMAGEFVKINEAEAKFLKSWRRPIVILQNKTGGKTLAPGVSNGFNTTGAMLPFMPFHHLLFKSLGLPAIVLTSGNISDEPIIIGNQQAKDELKDIADAFLHYNRDIHNRTDDSVLMVTRNEQRVIRRSRGFVPAPHNLRMHTDGIFASGAELVNCFCVGRGNQAIMSQHIGDLQNIETLEFYSESFRRFCRMFRVNPTHVATDLHPDYLSTRFAEDFASNSGGLPVIKIQHHHAHIASCMAENNLEGPVIGISLDGVGLGTDGHIWGFEVLKADYTHFERISHLSYIQQPGGDLATHEPWRMALSYLHKYIGPDVDLSPLPFAGKIARERLELVGEVLRLGINAPLTSSAGRLFDAVAAMTGTCILSDFHAEAPMRLEDAIDHHAHGTYEMIVGDTIDPGPMILETYRDIRNRVPVPTISKKFHNAIVAAIVNAAIMGRDRHQVKKVVLSGGVFQNRYLLENSIGQLIAAGFDTFTQSRFPSNDGGIALGQIAIAAEMRSKSLL